MKISTERREESPRQFFRCSWPEFFTNRRRFDRQIENQSYIEFLKTQSFDIDGEIDEENLSSDDDSLDEPEGEIEGHQEKRGNQHRNWSEDKDTEVRRFMAGMEGHEDFLDHDQVETVASFCEQARFSGEEINPGRNMKPVAFLDDRRIGDATVDGCRPCLGPLSPAKLQEQLSRKVSPKHMLVLEPRID